MKETVKVTNQFLVQQTKRQGRSPQSWIALGATVLLAILLIGIGPIGCGDRGTDGVREASGSTNIPAWVISYPGVEVKNANSIRVGGKKMGAFAQKTNDTVDQVAGYFERELRKAGFQTWNNDLSGSGTEERLVIATVEKPHRHMKVTIKASVSGAELEAEYGSDDPQ